MNKEVNRELKQLQSYLIKELQTSSIEFIDLLAYNRAKNELINKKYYGND